MKYINLIIAVLMGASFALAAPALVKDPIPDLAGSLGAADSMFLKTLNISVPAPDPESTSGPVPVGGALVKPRDPSYVHCNIWTDDNGQPIVTYMTSPDKVKNNIDNLRGRSDKPPTVEAGHLKMARCSDNSGIYWAVNKTHSDSYTVDSWDTIADGAQAVMDACSPLDADGWFDGAAVYNDVWWLGVSACS